ncbi:GNAT family N-acetyltransferase [Candidatus Nanosyncoccus nanoralicus]|uniref:dTDP-fucosamine acetyltransferase n=1 Tax=Candidatus Nanosyncoccus nanoralicus TaxID=2171996 RepID=A0ABY0FKP2_9BACT|nr:GNAT family N-acetyltransferase [Candidatus Nanosyncoccus nanoralicus]RYC73984.1 dTDP-fucosamine acetyltransferase [Candidatus Nanosyncoccus nanoralicus]
MIKIIAVTEYNKIVADRIRQLLIQLSRSGKDKGEIPQQWFEQLISSPWHDLLLAVESAKDGNVKQDHPVLPEQILGMASVSVIFGAGIGKNAYLEDFVVDQSARGKGIGNLLFNAYEDWAREKGCKNLEFTCGQGREAAQQFYRDHGAATYDTNFFRKKLDN